MNKAKRLYHYLFLRTNRFLSTPSYSAFFWFILAYLNIFVLNGVLYPIFLLLLVILGFKLQGKAIWIFFSINSVMFFVQTYYFSDSMIPLQAHITRFSLDFLISYFVVKIIKNYNQVQQQKIDLILTLANTLDSKDAYTAFHSENVANYALKIAKEMNLTEIEQEAIYLGGLVHDIGKVGIKEGILTKPAKLTEEEYQSIRNHPIIGYKMIKHITSFQKSSILDIVLYHHERYDGKGYPTGLKGENIPLEARIMCVADSFDAMTSKRTYREDKGMEWAVKEIEKNKGTQFDPTVVESFLTIWEREGPDISSNMRRL